VPLVISYPPAVPAGEVVTAPVSLRDVAITVADLAGIRSAPFPGRSLAPLWSDSTRARADTLVTELGWAPNHPSWDPLSKGTMRSVVLDGFRYIRYGDASEELFDFDRDTAEVHNLAGDPGHAPTLLRLRGALDAILRAHPPVRTK